MFVAYYSFFEHSFLVESDYIESVLRSMKHFAQRLDFVVSADGTDDSLEITETLYAKPFGDEWKVFLSLRRR